MTKRSFRLSARQKQVLRDELRQKGQSSDYERVSARPDPGVRPLSFGQRRLWFLDQLDPGSAAYNLPAAIRLRGRPDTSALRRSFCEIFRRHEVLRSSILDDSGEAHQVLQPDAELIQPLVDLTALPWRLGRAEGRRLARWEARHPFDLARGPLLRITFVKLTDDEHVVHLTLHHIAADGVSTDIALRELGMLYAAFSQGRPSPLPELGIQYADFAAWQQKRLRGERLEAQLGYWRERLADAPALLELPADRPRRAARYPRSGFLEMPLRVAIRQALRDLGRRYECTLFMVLLSAFKALLYRYTGQTDLSVGTPVAGRHRRETEGLIGFFVNTLVLRTDLSGDPGFTDFLARVKTVSMGAYAHQELPFERLVEALNPRREAATTPFYQVTLSLEGKAGVALPGLEPELLELENETAQFDLSLAVRSTREELSLRVRYNADLFDRVRIRRLLGHLRQMLEGIVAEPSRRLSQLELLSAPEQQQLFVDWNDTAKDFDPSRCVHELFRQHAERAPQAPAVAGSGLAPSLSYGEVEARSNRLAHHLQRLGVGPESTVGVYLERSPEMLVAILAVLKAGGAYVPLDPEYPAERLAFLMEDARAPVLLTVEALGGRLPQCEARVIRLDADAKAIAAESPDPPASRVSPENLAYLIYTSGSTGRPKGVQVPHGSLVHLLAWHRSTYSVTPADRATQLAGLGFDASVWEIWPYLAAGASLYLPDEETRLDPNRLAAWLETSGITVSFLPTPLAEAALQAEIAVDNGLRYLLTGGDRLRHYPPSGLGFELVNHYGPSETTVVATAVAVTDRPSAGAPAPPIGRPIANVRIYLLDRRLQPVPIGVAGEISIGGAGVARGYLARPAWTAERFLPDPAARGARLYRTGDLARYLADGNLDFLGRVDDQVKVRGYRLEPREIEVVLGRHPTVGQAVIAVREGLRDDRRLVAYVVPHGEPEVPQWRAYLQQKLPSYMVPSAFVVLAELPLTSHGKIDRRALPVPEASHPEERVFVAPRNLVEESLAGIWSRLLDHERIGVHDDFFELGGHSLLAMQLVSQVRQILKVDLPLRSLFHARTVAEMTRVILAHEATPGQTEKIIRLLKRLQGMSTDEVRETLQKKRQSNRGVASSSKPDL